MNEEIREILNKFDGCLENYEHDKAFGQLSVESICHLFPISQQTLKDYITNLQQDLNKANDIIEKDRQFYKCRMDKYAELKKKNEELNRMCELYSKSLYNAELTDYKSRCKRAIEYINFVINHYKEQLKTPIEDTYFDSDVNRKGYILSIIAYLQTILDTLIGSDNK